MARQVDQRNLPFRRVGEKDIRKFRPITPLAQKPVEAEQESTAGAKRAEFQTHDKESERQASAMRRWRA